MVLRFKQTNKNILIYIELEHDRPACLYEESKAKFLTMRLSANILFSCIFISLSTASSQDYAVKKEDNRKYYSRIRTDTSNQPLMTECTKSALFEIVENIPTTYKPGEQELTKSESSFSSISDSTSLKSNISESILKTNHEENESEILDRKDSYDSEIIRIFASNNTSIVELILPEEYTQKSNVFVSEIKLKDPSNPNILVLDKLSYYQKRDLARLSQIENIISCDSKCLKLMHTMYLNGIETEGIKVYLLFIDPTLVKRTYPDWPQKSMDAYMTSEGVANLLSLWCGDF